MKNNFIMICVMLLTIVACKNEKQRTNPLLAKWDTPFEVPPFDRIDTSDYFPAMMESIRQHEVEIEAIAENNSAPTFENTILAFDTSGKLLTRITNVFFNLLEANTNDQMQKIAEKISPILSEYQDNIYMNPKLFDRIKAVYDERQQMGLDDQQKRVTEKYYNDFVRSGASLDSTHQTRLKEINQELSLLSLKYGNNVLAETNNFKLIIDNKEGIEGLPQEVIDAAAEAAKVAGLKDKWVFTLAKPSMIPFLQYSERRDLREKIYRAYFMRGDNNNEYDNKKIIADMVKLRAEKAELLGYDNWASYVIAENMAKTPIAVDEFLMNLWNAALPVAKNEASQMQAIIHKEGGNFELEPWDWWYYAEKICREKYNIDENEIKPYFSLQNVRQGMFDVANKLYGITLSRRTDLPMYHKDVEAYEVKDADGSHLGILYLDYYPRAEKRVGAWCTEFRSAGWENGQRVSPVVSIVYNITPSTASTPSLLNWDETTTLFHEFGHALHALFAEGKYRRTAGIVPRDFVELPSQIMENWAQEPEVLKIYAKHYQTGEIIPNTLVQKIEKSGQFNQGFETVEYLAAAILDMKYHELASQNANIEPNTFEKKSMDEIGLIKEIIPRYRSTYFQHIFSGGYSAGYYVYIWAEVLDADAFDAFVKSGDVFNKELASKFRNYCLAHVGEDDAMTQYVKFRGQQPSIGPLLKRRGLK
ncbi:MAG TPA: M3 family metallopeptidase [Bacteroidales bacterium]|jgi:peptidyl-dipeptidase Dcp|nr:MAG: Peptidyl-dipeptidase dcp [Bacteroidetes bacterium ADurb.Bin012]HNQ60424.1 M3 family metallopeptidase [Bacteroidales bacterium]HNU22099.1 M3 family metallopeptidase [Bacteroidales bacterium]HNV17640.1 M3 family metallopeptidase [Bacteroidales bacterium]HNZ80079.1 M3 family metallopeptidase [Bacteroidales bacterium]